MTTTEGYALLPIEQLHESPLNPRKHFDKAALEELAVSIAAKGVLTPLLVRPNAKGFEVGAGHRRLRAAKLAGLGQLPAVVRHMSDADFLELIVVENDQREDVHPLEQAEGYKRLMLLDGYDAKRIAERIGRSEKWVYDRVKLLALTKAAQQLFLDGRITAGHAILLARLQPKDQARAIDPEDSRALFRHEDLLWTPAEEDADAPATTKNPYAGVKAGSVRELDKWINEHVRFDATAVDAVLFPETAAVLAPEADQKPRKVVAITYAHYIPEEARDGRTFFPQSWKRADGKAGSKTCDRAVIGVIAVGPDRGQAFDVCVSKEKCDIHWGKERRAAAKRPAGSVGSGRAAPTTSWQQEEAKRKAERDKAEALRARWKKALPEILAFTAMAVKKTPVRPKGPIGTFLREAIQMDYGHKDYAQTMMPPIGDAEALCRHLAFKLLANEAQQWTGVEQFPKLAKAFGVDALAIMAKLAPAPKPAVQTAAKTGPAKKKAAKK